MIQYWFSIPSALYRDQMPPLLQTRQFSVKYSYIKVVRTYSSRRMRVSLIFYSNFEVLIGTPALLPGLTLLENNVRVVGNVHVFDLVDIVEV